MNSNPHGAKERVLQVWPDATCIQTVADSQHKSYCWIHRGDNNIAAHEERIGQGRDEASAWSDASTRLPTSGAPVAPPSVEPQRDEPTMEETMRLRGKNEIVGCYLGELMSYFGDECDAWDKKSVQFQEDLLSRLYDAAIQDVVPPVTSEGQPLKYLFYASESNEDGVVVRADSILANIHESMCMCDRGPDECGTEGVQGTIIEAAQALLTMGRWAIDFEDGWIKIVPLPAPPERTPHDR